MADKALFCQTTNVIQLPAHLMWCPAQTIIVNDAHIDDLVVSSAVYGNWALVENSIFFDDLPWRL